MFGEISHHFVECRANAGGGMFNHLVGPGIGHWSFPFCLLPQPLAVFLRQCLRVKSDGLHAALECAADQRQSFLRLQPGRRTLLAPRLSVTGAFNVKSQPFAFPQIVWIDVC